MKIIYYSPHPTLNLAAPSGPGTHMREVIAGFERAGHEVIPLILGGTKINQEADIQISQSGTRKLTKKLLPESVWQTIKDWNLRRFDRQVAQQKLAQLVDSEQPDLIYERGYYLMTSGVKVAKDKSVRHMIELNAPYPEEKMQMEGLSYFVNKSNTCEYEQVSMTDRVIVVSSALKDYLADRYPTHTDKVYVTPNAVNRGKLRVDSTRVEELRQEFSFSECTILGFVGSIFPYHGVKELLELFPELVPDYPKLRLLIVGDGAILGELKAFAKEKNIDNRIVFTGNVKHTDVPNHIDLMDITIMPRSNWYGSPVKIFEYGLLNKAIIAPDNVPVRDVMENGQDGILIPADQIAMKSAIKALISDPATRKSMAASFHNKVLEKYNWDKVVKTILS